MGQLHCNSWQSIKFIQQGIKEHGEGYLVLFAKVESLRIDQYIKANFPGLWRHLQSLQVKSGITDYPEDLFGKSTDLTVLDSLALCDELIGQKHELPDLIYQSGFIPELMIEQVIDHMDTSPLILNREFDVDASLLSDLGDTEGRDRGYLRSAGESTDENVLSESRPGMFRDPDQQGFENAITKHLEKGVYYYKEWDTSLNKYRNDWCRIKEEVEATVTDEIVIENSETLRYAEHRIRKTFDMLINDQKFMRFQSDGDEIDLDAWVSARSNRNRNSDDYQNLYIRNNRNSRDVAIMFAVDMSGSTSGWKNTMIKQSTWLLCKTLARLGDQYAVYGFSGSGRSDCRIYPIKTFDDNYDKSVKTRIFSMKPKQYTRMGAAIRHLSMVLGKATAKTRILFVLTDGKPDDVDSYRGQYGIDDTRLALNEAKAMTLKPFVLTFDKHGMEYLPYMLGSNRYQLITDISQLPIQISSIYKQLTT
jgi:nitric oxide reductase NorD protein